MISVQGLCQLNEQNSSAQVYYSEDPLLNIPMEKIPGKENQYAADHPYSSCHLNFYKDSTFVFYYVDSDLYRMACGKYFYINGVYVLYSDSISTAKAVVDPEFYKKFFKFKTPTAQKIERVAYIISGDLLLPFHNSQGKQKIELLNTSNDFLEHKLQMTAFRNLYYSLSGKEIVVDYNADKRVSVDVDSLWGFVIFKKGFLETYRKTPKGFNWYGMPGVQVVQTTPFVIYTVGEGRIYSYFSRDLNSRIYPLKLEQLKKEFKENQKFIEALNKEFGPHKLLSVKGEAPHSYRILEIYNECLSE